MRFHKLRIAGSVFWGLACVLSIVLWVRSYEHCEYLTHIRSGNRLTIFGSNAGVAYFLSKTDPGKFTPALTLGWEYRAAAVESVDSHRKDHAAGETFIVAPYWLSV